MTALACWLACGCASYAPVGGSDGGADGSSAAVFKSSCSVDTAVSMCSCRIADSTFKPDSTQCTPTTVENGLCCADPGYPKAGTTCTCTSVHCKQRTFDCMCSTLNSSGTNQCTGTYCCVDNTFGGCTCGDSTCFMGYTTVPSCHPSDVLCGQDKMAVDKCHVP